MAEAATATPPELPTKPIPEGFTARTEGKATILQHGNDVFYNPAQVINRDLSIAVLRYFAALRATEPAPTGRAAHRARRASPTNAAEVSTPPTRPGLTVLEGLAASGLRAIRYAQEVPGLARVVANDLDPSVVEALRRNVAFNGAPAVDLVEPSVGDARLVMLRRAGEFDAVDLDPYGSPSQLLDSAVQAVADGGLLLCTATDMAVLCGNNSETCFAKYGAYPLHKPYCHEQALRILLGAIETAAARYKRHIVPLVSLSIDFYVRVFVRVYTNANEVKNSATRMGYVWQSQGCDSFYWQRMGRRLIKGSSVKYAPGSGPAVPQACPETGAGFTMGGPFWAEALHSAEALAGILQVLRSDRAAFPAYAKVHSILTAASEELLDAPLYVNLHDVCKTLKCSAPRAEALRSAIVNAGYRVSSTHACALGLKTDCPWNVFWDIMRCWIAEHPVKNVLPGSCLEKILAKAPEHKANFARATSALSKARTSKVARYLPNPEANWGPKPKHGRGPKQAEAGAQVGAANGAHKPSPDEDGGAEAVQEVKVAAPQ
ncbi:hypothetical protein ACKKBG_A22240 [Auxenochlorella protothecoides x Auxenochlorella symbiontica]